MKGRGGGLERVNYDITAFDFKVMKIRETADTSDTFSGKLLYIESQ